MSNVAMCKFCGQVAALDVPDGADEREREHLGTMDCNCPSATTYREKHRRGDIAKLEIENMARQKSDDVAPIPLAVCELLRQAVDLMVSDSIYKINVGLCVGGSIDIKCNSSGKMQIKHSVTRTDKREVE